MNPSNYSPDLGDSVFPFMEIRAAHSTTSNNSSGKQMHRKKKENTHLYLVIKSQEQGQQMRVNHVTWALLTSIQGNPGPQEYF